MMKEEKRELRDAELESVTGGSRIVEVIEDSFDDEEADTDTSTGLSAAPSIKVK